MKGGKRGVQEVGKQERKAKIDSDGKDFLKKRRRRPLHKKAKKLKKESIQPERSPSKKEGGL
jgi:hypothetical protein